MMEDKLEIETIAVLERSGSERREELVPEKKYKM